MNWGIDTLSTCAEAHNGGNISIHTHTNANMNIDKVWFQEKLAAKKLSQRKLAKILDLDPSTITVMLNGNRKMTMQEAQAIAGQLTLPVTEVMRKAGIDVRDDIKKVPIGGYIAKGSVATLLPKGTHDMIQAPADVPATGFALQVRISGSPHDGWMVFVDGSQLAPNEMLDRASIVALQDGRLLCCVLRRGYKAGTHNLTLMPELGTLENQHLAWASPILWIKPL